MQINKDIKIENANKTIGDITDNIEYLNTQQNFIFSIIPAQTIYGGTTKLSLSSPLTNSSLFTINNNRVVFQRDGIVEISIHFGGQLGYHTTSNTDLGVSIYKNGTRIMSHSAYAPSVGDYYYLHTDLSNYCISIKVGDYLEFYSGAPEGTSWGIHNDEYGHSYIFIKYLT